MAAAEHQQTTVPAAASTAVAELISGQAQPAEIIASFPVATYLRVDAAVIALVTPDAVRLPNALVCREMPQVADGGGVLVGDGRVQLGRTRVTVGRWWDPVVRLPLVYDPAALGRSVAAMQSLLPGWPAARDPAAEELVAGRKALSAVLAGEGTADVAAERLVGLGPGLTPAGDDLLAGAVAGLMIFGRALERSSAVDLAGQVAVAVADRAARTTDLAADLARHAATGAVAEPMGAVCRVLAGGHPLEPALERLLAIGHSSGRDLAEGLLLGVTAALQEGRRAVL